MHVYSKGVTMKRIVAVLLIVLLLPGWSACGSQSVEPAATTMPASAEEAAPPSAMVEEPLAVPAYIEASLSFYLEGSVIDDEKGVYSLSLIRREDNKFIRYDTDYSRVECEADGFEVLSQESVSSGEELTVKLTPPAAELRIAVITLKVMDGDATKATFSFYGLNSDKGRWVLDSTGLIWGDYFLACYQAGEITADERDQFIDIVQFAWFPFIEDPRLYAGKITVLIQPKDITVESGSKASSFFGILGSGLTYQWQYYNAETKAWEDIPRAASRILDISARESYNGLYYRCTAKDNCGNSVTSDPAKLIVLPESLGTG